MKRLVPKIVQAEMDRVGATAVPGSKHVKIMLAGRVISIWPLHSATEGSPVATRNCIGSIRRAGRGVTAR
jgi:hypothetical protein